MPQTIQPPLPRRLQNDDLPADARELARALIGKSLIHTLPNGPLGVRIVETESYPAGDPASLAFKGRTAHNSPLFGGLGQIYVYLCYGVSWLTNIAASADNGDGAGVLFRAGEPVWGLGEMIERRHRSRITELTSGPGKLSAALGIGPDLNGGNFFDSDALWLGEAVRATAAIAVSTRIGISKAVEQPLQFYESGSPFVSRRGARVHPG